MKRTHQRSLMRTEYPEAVMLTKWAIGKSTACCRTDMVNVVLFGFGLLLLANFSTAVGQNSTAQREHFVNANVTSYYLIIDTSASMNEVPQPPRVPAPWEFTKFTEVKRQLAELCENLPTESSVRIFLFDEGPPREGARFDLLASQERQLFHGFFAALRAEGTRTFAWRALDHILTTAGNELLGSSRTSGIRILMYTDGLDNDPARPSLTAVLAKHRNLLQDKNGPVQLNYLTLGFTLSAEMRDLFASYGVAALPAVRPEDVMPLIASFSWKPEQPRAGEEVQFIDRSNGVIAGYSWDFGGVGHSTEKAPVYRFDKAGQYRLRLIIKSPGRRSQSVERTIVVAAPPALAPRFQVFPSEVKSGDPVLFRNLTSGPGAAFLWEFGDGNRSADRDPTHAYGQPGTYSVTLRALNEKGDEKSVTLTNAVRVIGPPQPVADFVGPDQVTVEETFKVVDRSVGEIDELVWDFGDGTPTRKERDVQHAYTRSGAYTLTLTCFGPGGTNSVSKTVQVKPIPAPVAGFITVSDLPIAGEPVRFIDRSTGRIDRHEWWFPGNQKPVVVDVEAGSHQDTPITHRFDAPGEHTVRLIVIGPGGRDEFKREVRVFVPPPPPAAPPQARFEVDQHAGRAPLTVNFCNLSEGTIQRFVLDFDDGSRPREMTNFVDCSYIYENPGNYTPTLRAIGSELFQPSIYSLPRPIATKSPPSWLQRHWPWLGIALCGAAAALGLLRKIVQRRRWVVRHQNLSGAISLKRSDRNSFPWQQFPIAGANGKFEMPLPVEIVGRSEPAGKRYALRLKKLLDAGARREHFSAELIEDGEVLEVFSIEPGVEQILRKPPITVRYDN